MLSTWYLQMYSSVAMISVYIFLTSLKTLRINYVDVYIDIQYKKVYMFLVNVGDGMYKYGSSVFLGLSFYILLVSSLYNDLFDFFSVCYTLLGDKKVHQLCSIVHSSKIGRNLCCKFSSYVFYAKKYLYYWICTIAMIHFVVKIVLPRKQFDKSLDLKCYVFKHCCY